MGRAPCCDKAKVKRGPWSPEEDAKLKDFIDKYGTGGNWIALPQKAGLKRCGKSCRLRWLNYLRPNIKHGEFSDEEDRIICSLFHSIGSRWSIIAAQLPGRTDNDIKNYWNTKLKKKLMGIVNLSSSTTSLNISPLPFPSFSQTTIQSAGTTTTTISSGESLVGPMHTIPIFGGEPSSSSSDGSMVECHFGGLISDSNNNWAHQRSTFHGQLWESAADHTTPLEYEIEEIKQLVSTNFIANCNNYIDESSSSRVMYY
ncbi:hypothetical protein Scep_005163 [Stephania cephalantha]|uniref:Uncharacterized protein n=1 Tax=Stephania cephalantha TaxID=152367 RepID=A0AAP0PXY1_9MAGN